MIDNEEKTPPEEEKMEAESDESEVDDVVPSPSPIKDNEFEINVMDTEEEDKQETFDEPLDRILYYVDKATLAKHMVGNDKDAWVRNFHNIPE